MTTIPEADLATKLVNEWAADRYTQPTPAELDFARWILELLDEAWEPRTLFQVAHQKRAERPAVELDPELEAAHAAFESWYGTRP